MEAVATTVGASMISAILEPMARRAGTVIADQCDFMVNIKREIDNLQSTLSVIQGVIQDAEEKQIVNIAIRNWLRLLVDIGYEARDVLDDFFTFSASIRAKGASTSVKFNCLPFSFSLSCFNVGSSSSTVPVALPFRLRFQLANDIRSVRKRFDELWRQNDIFSILNPESVPKRRRPETGPFINKQNDLFVGREEMKENIMKKLLHPNDNSVHLVPLWGMGGIGKTTLAQSIYNDKTLKEGDYPIKNRRWLFVGEKKFNVMEIIEKIINKSYSQGIEVVQRKLVKKFEGDKFLIVLDDVWDVDRTEWELLWNPLTNVGKGGVIIITTREKKVLNAITTTPLSNYLEPLSDEDCWQIFESYAFFDKNINDNLDEKVIIGRHIVKKLKGLPLAVNIVGRSLLNEPEVETWKNFLDAQEWKQRNDENDVMPALRWSYNRLPPHLKQCFVYCALFPKDHALDEKALVEMWMAHDFIQNAGGGGEERRPEDVGAQYFKELVCASLIQCVNNQYVMHDIIHDLALLVSNEEFATANGLLSTDKMEKVCHITIIPDDDYSKKLRLCKGKRILTLYTHKYWIYEGYPTCSYIDILQDAFKHLKSIRVLVLASDKITDIPNCISELRHLRYLDVRGTRIRSLPDSLCQLYNLQMLAASFEAVLPRDIVNIPSLRYVRANFPTCNGVGKLTSLQELSSISVCKDDDNIGELGSLRQLRGRLEIKGLENVTSSNDASQALLQEKLYLLQLILKFSTELGKNTIAEEILDALQCPPKLEYLEIDGYTGFKPPSWMVNGKLVDKLKILKLSSCNQLKSLTYAANVMRSLTHLEIDHCEKITKMECGSLPSLSRVIVRKCDELISISGLIGIKELDIRSCGQLKSLSTHFQGLDYLERLSIERCPLLELICEERSISSSSSSTLVSSSPWSRLQDLVIDNESIFRNIFEQDLISIGCLWISEDFSVIECLRKVMENSCHKLKSLKCLRIFGIDNLHKLSLPLELRKLSSLERFDILSCHQLQSFPDDALISLPHSLKTLSIIRCLQLQSLSASFLPHFLEGLIIMDCPQLQSLPVDGLPLSLRNLWIIQCPLLYERYKDETGPYWRVIKNV